jgi:hypothetical protein
VLYNALKKLKTVTFHILTIEIQLFIYKGHLLQDNLIKLFSNTWKTQQIQKDWKTGLLLNIPKKEKNMIIIEEPYYCQPHKNCMQTDLKIHLKHTLKHSWKNNNAVLETKIPWINISMNL